MREGASRFRGRDQRLQGAPVTDENDGPCALRSVAAITRPLAQAGPVRDDLELPKRKPLTEPTDVAHEDQCKLSVRAGNMPGELSRSQRGEVPARRDQGRHAAEHDELSSEEEHAPPPSEGEADPDSRPEYRKR